MVLHHIFPGSGNTILISGSNITIQTPTFYFGSGVAGNAYISGSGSKLAISSSGFYLNPLGGVSISGSISASSGQIGGMEYII